MEKSAQPDDKVFKQDGFDVVIAEDLLIGGRTIRIDFSESPYYGKGFQVYDVHNRGC